MRKPSLTLYFLCCYFAAFSQTNISGIINHYASVLDHDYCESILTLDDASSFSVGESVLIIQMKGGTINESNSSNFGTITSQGGAGLFERSTIIQIIDNQIYLDTWLVNTYTNFDDPIQVLNIPIYENVIVTDTLKAKAWDGTTGGVLAFDVNGLLEINAPIDVSGLGFRGGVSETVSGNNCSWLINHNDYGYPTDNWRGALKGEGITNVSADNVAGRGAPANGGGGGNDHNSGGGGGGHAGSGGIGGENDEPSTFGCDGEFPGLGGKELNLANGERIFLGGGGGAGHGNNGVGSNGGNGGGMVMIHAADIDGTLGTIWAKGSGAEITAGGDGAGGGGAGGTIWLQAENISNEVILNADGFAGCNVNNQTADRCFGPGGGGAGGAIYTNQLGVSGLLFASANGGTAGITTNTSSSCEGNSLGALGGELGLTTTEPILPIGPGPVGNASLVIESSVAVFCTGDNGIISAEYFGLSTDSYTWYINDGSGSTQIMEMPPFSGTNSNMLMIDNIDATLSGQTIYCIADGTCAGEVQSNNIILDVTEAPIANFDFSISGFEVTFNNQSTGGTNYQWNFGDMNTSTEVSPIHSYTDEGVYYVSLMLENDCGSVTYQDSVLIGSPLMPNFSTDVSTGCVPLGVQFTDETPGLINSWDWLFPGGTPSTSTEQNPFITYSEPGIYPVTLAATNGFGGVSITYANLIQVGETPILDFDVNANGLTINLINNSQFTDNYQWNFGDGSPVSNLENPSHTYTAPGTYDITLTGNNAFCEGEAITITIEVGPSVTINLQNPEWNVFPNPVGKELTISAEYFSGNLTLSLFDVQGRKQLERALFFDGEVLLNLEGLSAGVYFLRLERKEEVSVFRVVKN
jgi:PKD repeat protein